MSVPRIALLVIDDRGWGHEALNDFGKHARCVESIKGVETVDDQAHELGFCGAIREGWRKLREHKGWDYVFHLESDFRFLAPFDLGVMAGILENDGDLAQIALKRGPHGSEPEGGFMAAWPDSYTPSVWMGEGVWRSVDYLRHDNFFTTNPSLYPREIVERYAWPAAPACEAKFAETLLADGWAMAYLGKLDDPPLVEHIGATRIGKGY